MQLTKTEKEYVRCVIHAKQEADRGRSKLSDTDVLQLVGMSGIKTRHLYNNIINGISMGGGYRGRSPHPRYIEVGSWLGSTLVSAMYGNPHCAGVAIDNWSEFEGPKAEFKEIVQRHIPDAWLNVIEGDCFSQEVADKLKGRKFNVYLYDGPHEYADHKKAITHFYSFLDFPCIVIVDDWNWEQVRRGTHDGLAEVGARVVYQQEIRLTNDDTHTDMDIGAASYWNGVAVFVLGEPNVHHL